MGCRPGSRSHSRSRPTRLHLQTTGIHGFEFDDTTSNNGSVSTTANIEKGSPYRQVSVNGEGAAAGGSGNGRSLLTRNLQMLARALLWRMDEHHPSCCSAVTATSAPDWRGRTAPPRGVEGRRATVHRTAGSARRGGFLSAKFFRSTGR